LLLMIAAVLNQMPTALPPAQRRNLAGTLTARGP